MNLMKLRKLKTIVITPADVAGAAYDLGETVCDGIVERGRYKNEITASRIEFDNDYVSDKEDLKQLKERYKTKKIMLKAIKELRAAGADEEQIKAFIAAGM